MVSSDRIWEHWNCSPFKNHKFWKYLCNALRLVFISKYSDELELLKSEHWILNGIHLFNQSSREMEFTWPACIVCSEHHFVCLLRYSYSGEMLALNKVLYLQPLWMYYISRYIAKWLEWWKSFSLRRPHAHAQEKFHCKKIG